MPYTHRGTPVSGNRTDNRRMLKEAIDNIRTYVGMGSAAGYPQERRRKNMGPFK